MRKLIVAIVLCILSIFLVAAIVLDRAVHFYNQSPPASQHYLTHALSETGTENVVAAVLFDYRSFDTLGEVLVILTAALAISLIFANRTLPKYGEGLSLIVKASLAIYTPAIILMGMYTILFSPGGGFKGGVVLGAVAWIYLIAFGSPNTSKDNVFGAHKWQIAMGITALSLLATACLPIMWGEPFLTNVRRGLASLLPGGNAAVLSILTGFAVALGIGIIFFSMVRVAEEEG